MATAGLWLTGRGFHQLLFVAPLAGEVFTREAKVRLEASDLDGTRKLATLARPAWLAVATCAMLEGRESGADPLAEAESVRDDLREAAARRIYALRGVGRIASPLALLGVILELTAAFGTDHGLLALQRGLVVSQGLSRAVTTLCMGLMTTIVCVVAARLLQRHLLALGRELDGALESLARELPEVVKGET